MNKDKPFKHLWTILAVLSFIALLIVAYKIKDSLSPAITTTATLNKSCDLRQGECLLKLPNGGQVSFSISPNHIPVLQPLELKVTISDIKVSAIEVDFVGVDMDMGYNRSKLQKIDEQHFKGKVIIPVCAHSKMEWEARMLLKTDKGLSMAPFRFYTVK